MPLVSTAQKRKLFIASAYIVNVVGIATKLYSSTWYWKQPYHTSKLTGAEWVKELINGHHDRIWCELGMRVHVFLAFVHELRVVADLRDSKYVTLDEQAAIFLYMSVTGLSVRHVGERFQHSNETISRYFRKILQAISSGPFYKQHVYLPQANCEVDPFIRDRPKFYPYFSNVIGAMDGTHINCCPSAADRQAARNRKGGVTQNCLACVSFGMRFQYVLSGWEGSVADATMYSHSRLTDLRIPNGKCYLADAGFGICDSLLVPYRGVRYHLAEWGRAKKRPANKEELYNLRHASARNVVERVFGVLKRKWGILVRPPQFSMAIQALVPPAMCALHNFILGIDPNDMYNYLTGNDENDLDPSPGQIHTHDHSFGDLAEMAVTSQEKARAVAYRDHLAKEMWINYQEILRQRQLAGEVVDDSDSEDSGE